MSDNDGIIKIMTVESLACLRRHLHCRRGSNESGDEQQLSYDGKEKMEGGGRGEVRRKERKSDVKRE